jgi:hypothetical protein
MQKAFSDGVEELSSLQILMKHEREGRKETAQFRVMINLVVVCNISLG